MAFETFRHNFLRPDAPFLTGAHWPDWLPQSALDIEALLSDNQIREHLRSLRGTVDLITAGPPCQGFSVGGIRDGKDQRNRLPQRCLDFVNLVKPRIVLIENVEGMAREFVSKPGLRESAYSDWLVSRLGEMGYQASFRVVNASHFGVPQLRRRVVILGFLPGVGRDRLCADEFFSILAKNAAEFRASRGLPTDRPVTVLEAIDDLDGDELVDCPDSQGFKSGTYKAPRSSYAKAMRANGLGGRVPQSHRFSHHGPGTLAFYAKVHDTQPFGRLSKEFLMQQGTRKDKKVFIDPGAPASTITTHPDEFIHYHRLRNISVREMARLQSFPDNFEFRGRYTINGPRRRFDVARCSQVGNAVPPLMGEALGMAVRDFLAMEDTQAPNLHVPYSDQPNCVKGQMVLLAGV